MPCSHCGQLFPVEHIWRCRVVEFELNRCEGVRSAWLCDTCRDAWLEREASIAELAEPDLVPA